MTDPANSPVNGLHHVTAIASDAAANVRFWRDTLGLRFIKKTVNFDDPGTYHLYYGDETGSAGTVMTFFPWAGVPRGRSGTGETSATRFSVPEGSLPFWRQRLEAAGSRIRESTPLFGDTELVAEDTDGLVFALVERSGDTRGPWTTSEIDGDHAVRGFDSVTLRLSDTGASRDVLTGVLGYKVTGDDGKAVRLANGGGNPAATLDLIQAPGTPPAGQGAGRVHHIAFAVEDDAAHARAREMVSGLGIPVTPFIDRNYFHSIYFREPGGVLFEIATHNPGFTVDENVGELGQGLKLPAQHEHLRAELEKTLPELPA